MKLSASFNVSLISELFSYLLLVLFLYSGYIRFGWKTTFLFLVASIYWTMPLENFGVLMNFFNYCTPSTSLCSKYLLWIGNVPFWISIGWFDVTFPAFHISDYFVKANTWTKAVVGGLIAVNLDLILDPAATSSKLWIWTHESFYILGVPVTNYIAWFLLVTLFIIVFEKTVFRKESINFMKPIENILFKGLQNSSSNRNMVVTLFLRLTFFQLLFIIIYTPISAAFMHLSTIVG